jgi:hypothetical protein
MVRFLRGLAGQHGADPVLDGAAVLTAGTGRTKGHFYAVYQYVTKNAEYILWKLDGLSS